VERLVKAQFTAYAEINSLLPVHQSAYRSQHSTETALVHIYNDMVATVDRGNVGALVLLDMSAVVDTIGHPIMLDVLKQRSKSVRPTGSPPTSAIAHKSSLLVRTPRLSANFE